LSAALSAAPAVMAGGPNILTAGAWKGRISKSEMAKRMGTSRSQLERLLDPENPHVLLETVQKAATAVGKRLTIGLTDAPRAA